MIVEWMRFREDVLGKKTQAAFGCREHLNKGRWKGFDAVLHYSKGAHTGILQGLREGSGRRCTRLGHAAKMLESSCAADWRAWSVPDKGF